MAWMSPKRRGRAQRRVSGKTQLVRGQLNFGLVRRRDQIANEKIAAAAGRTMREVIPTAFVAVRTMWAA